MYSSEQRSVRWENQRPYLHLVLTSILHPSSDLVLINVWHENVTKSELSFPREITNTALPLLITVKIKSSSGLAENLCVLFLLGQHVAVYIHLYITYM